MLEHTNNIKYPIFIQCCQYITDKYWYSIFKELSYGNPPFGCTIKNNALIYKNNTNYKNKFVYHFDNINKNPKTICNDVTSLLKSKLNLISPSERVNNIDSLIKPVDLSKSKNTWNDIKKKSDREYLIEKFTIDSMKKYNINIIKIKKLQIFLNINILFNCIKSNDISINCSGYIDNIEGINFKNNEVIILEDIYNIDIKDEQLNDNKEIKKILDKWIKYISSLQNSFFSKNENENTFSKDS